MQGQRLRNPEAFVQALELTTLMPELLLEVPSPLFLKTPSSSPFFGS